MKARPFYKPVAAVLAVAILGCLLPGSAQAVQVPRKVVVVIPAPVPQVLKPLVSR